MFVSSAWEANDLLRGIEDLEEETVNIDEKLWFDIDLSKYNPDPWDHYINIRNSSWAIQEGL